MRLLLIHASQFEYEVREEAVREPEPLREGAASAAANDVLVAFCTVESEDEEDPVQVAVEGAKAIDEVARAVGTQRLVIYPYAHLSSSLASRDAAIKVLEAVDEKLRQQGYAVVRSPFGYYKRFKLHCLGHPLSELSRTIRPEKKPETRPAVETVHMVMDLEGNLYDPREYRFKPTEEDFRVLVEKEALKKESAGGTPSFLQYCRKFGIEWEPYSDLGHMRYGPEAVLMFDLISDYSLQLAQSIEVPVLQVKGTNIFDLSVRAVREHADLFGGRLYKIDLGDKSFVMRYAACHQQFSSVKDWSLSYRHLPFGTFEVADGYRLEQSGELLLCFRVRKLHMPDFHIYCRGLEEAKEVSRRVHHKIYEEVRKLGRDYVSLYNLTRGFFEANRDYVLELARFEGKPVLLNFVPDGVYYWVLNVEYNVIDELERPREIATFQIDIGNAERFGISYTDEHGTVRHPTIIHTALIGTIERYLYTILDRCAKDGREGRKPMLPLWLSPVQVRLIPVTAEYLKVADEIAARLIEAGIRADVDDRDETVQKRVREGEVGWIPYILVIGAKEARSGSLTVRRRRDGSQSEMTLGELIEEIRLETKGYPYRPLTLPLHISQRPGYKEL